MTERVSHTCPVCGCGDLERLLTVEDCPVFQNKVYATQAQALAAVTHVLDVRLCCGCGFVFNSQFDYSLMEYDASYQNEQSGSVCFDRYTDSLVEMLSPFTENNATVVEIGCGKGTFLEKLRKAGVNVRGFDPAYEGDNPAITRDYFGPKYSDIHADVIILRHTLEHVPAPLDFLHVIAQANRCHGKVFIEVPSLDWILEKRAFYDFSYEHCNYFYDAVLKSLFSDCLLHRRTLGSQYQVILADLATLKKDVCGQLPCASDDSFSKTAIVAAFERLRKAFNAYAALLDPHRDGNVFLWGAGAKGANFANFFDPENRKITALVDINPRKQGRFVGGSGHRVISPGELLSAYGSGVIFIMNSVYAAEIRSRVSSANFSLCAVEELFE